MNLTFMVLKTLDNIKKTDRCIVFEMLLELLAASLLVRLPCLIDLQ